MRPQPYPKIDCNLMRDLEVVALRKATPGFLTLKNCEIITACSSKITFAFRGTLLCGFYFWEVSNVGVSGQSLQKNNAYAPSSF
jgi:hypothetical protein